MSSCRWTEFALQIFTVADYISLFSESPFTSDVTTFSGNGWWANFLFLSLCWNILDCTCCAADRCCGSSIIWAGFWAYFNGYTPLTLNTTILHGHCMNKLLDMLWKLKILSGTIKIWSTWLAGRFVLFVKILNSFFLNCFIQDPFRKKPFQCLSCRLYR